MSGMPPHVPHAVLRTAIKLLPRELAHLSGFALETAPALQWTCIVLSTVLIVVYFAWMIAAHGRRSIRDWIALTEVTGNFARGSR